MRAKYNYLIVSRGDDNSSKVIEKLIDFIPKGVFKKIESEEIEEKIKNNKKVKLDIVFSVGGDGTFLRASHDYREFDPLFITINTGNFGYLCEFDKDNLSSIFAIFYSSMEKRVKEISLLELIHHDYSENKDYKYYAINEFRICSKDERTIEFDVSINDHFLERLRGDGVVIASSLGSSGIAKSLGGPLIDNEVEMIEFIENAPISNAGYFSINSPLILSKENIINLSIFNVEKFNIYYDSKTLEITDFDNNSDGLGEKCDYLSISLSNKKIRVLKNLESSYIEKTRKSFVKS